MTPQPTRRPVLRPTRRGRSDGGSASLWVVGAATLIVLVASLTAIRTAAVVVRHRAESAADLAALAGAGRIGVDSTGCASASAIARRNGARLTSCRSRLAPDLRSGTVTVRVELTVRLPLAGVRHVTASARAGRLPGVAA